MKTCLFVGVDTHKDSHAAAVANGYFEVVATISFDNSTEVFNQLFGKLISAEEILSLALKDNNKGHGELPSCKNEQKQCGSERDSGIPPDACK